MAILAKMGKYFLLSARRLGLKGFFLVREDCKCLKTWIGYSALIDKPELPRVAPLLQGTGIEVLHLLCPKRLRRGQHELGARFASRDSKLQPKRPRC